MFYKKSLSISDEILQKVENFPSSYRGEEGFSPKVQEIICNHITMIERTKNEIGPLFNEEEWNYLRDLLNSSLVLPEKFPLKTIIPVSIEDGDKYEGLGEKWGVDPQQLAEKVRSLTEFQIYTICKLIDEYWARQ